MSTAASPFAAFSPALAPEHEAVAARVQDGLSRVETMFAEQIRSGIPPVQALCDHVERYRGKMLRPTMVLLTAMAARSDDGSRLDRPTDDHIAIATVIEMIHVATLVHDDVLDDADTRRGGATVNRLRGNEAAVILGDYLISNAFHLCSRIQTLHGSQAPSTIIGAVTTRLCEGELLQLHHREDFALDQRTYFEIVQRKTAELVGVACDLGARYAGASDHTRRLFREFGIRLGVAFQIQDDLLDLTGSEDVVGKSVGKDLEKGKLTLPVIHHLEHVSAGEREATMGLLRRRAAGEPVGDLVLERLASTGSIDAARDHARRLVSEARALLEEAASGPAAALLHAIANAVVARDR